MNARQEQSFVGRARVAPSLLAVVALLFALAASLVSPRALAQHAPLPASLVALDSPEGQRIFAEAEARADFFALSEHYVTQKSGNFCGVASGVMVLNALQVTAPIASEVGSPFFTQENFWNERARGVLSPTMMPGMTIDQLADLMQCHPATARAVHAADTTLADFRARTTSWPRRRAASSSWPQRRRLPVRAALALRAT
jgi:hypothetical protein